MYTIGKLATQYQLSRSTFLFSSLFTVFLHASFRSGEQKRVFQSIGESFRFILSARLLLRVLVVIALVHVFFGGLEVVLPIFASSTGKTGLQFLAYLQVSLGIVRDR